MKRWLSFFVVVLVLALLSHGVVLPRVLWANQLEGLQAAFPELHINSTGWCWVSHTNLYSC